MSAYTDAVAALTATTRLEYRLGEASGTTFADSGVDPLNLHLALTKQGTPSMGQGSLLPNAPADLAVLNTAEVPIASRADNGLIDRPTPGTSISLNCWFWAGRQEASATQSLISKASVYNLVIVGSSLRFDIGTTQLLSQRDVVVPNKATMVTATYSPASGMLTYIDGVPLAFQARSGNPPWSSGTTALEIGGLTTFGSQGFYGLMQHVGIWFDRVLTTPEVQGLYQAAVASEGEVAGKSANVFNWSRTVLGVNGSRTYARITNVSDSRIFLTLGASASLNSGVALMPGEKWETPNQSMFYGDGPPPYQGAVSAIAESASGVKRIAIHEE